jgi:hypothetical protein
MANGDSLKTLEPAQISASSAGLEDCRDGIEQTPMLENWN